jgi:HD-like signal output (HDOD) protein
MSEDQSQQTKEKSELGFWLKKISETELPVLDQTVQKVSKLTSEQAGHTSSLVSAILQDAGMTARVLRMANSAFFNSTGQKLNTVSRAVFVLGFDRIRSVCLSVVLIESLLKGKPRDQLLLEMARSFHAAVQARNLAIEKMDPAPEEVFIAAFLFRLGQMAFWCFADSTGEKLEEALKTSSGDPKDIEKNVLGFALEDLTTELVKKWKISDLLIEAMDGDASNTSRGFGIILAHRLAEAAEQDWSSKATKDLTEQLSKFINKPYLQVKSILETNSQEARQIALQFGAKASARLIPAVEKEPDNVEETNEILDEILPDFDQMSFLEADTMLQLRILRELSQMIDTGADFNTILETVLEGIYRGIGMDRAVFALLTPDRTRLKCKFAHGAGNAYLMELFDIPVTEADPNIFTKVLSKKERKFFKHPPLKDDLIGASDRLKKLIGLGAMFVAPVIVDGQTIGIFYADRQPSGRVLDKESFESFTHFVQQANFGLEQLAKKSSKK